MAAIIAEEKLEYVSKYFRHRKGELSSLEDVYVAVLWSANTGKPPDYARKEQLCQGS